MGAASPGKIALNKRQYEPDPSRAKEGMRAAAPAARKLHMSETAGHQSGRRVWKSGSLRSERKDLCESRDFNAILKGLAAPAQD